MPGIACAAELGVARNPCPHAHPRALFPDIAVVGYWIRFHLGCDFGLAWNFPVLQSGGSILRNFVGAKEIYEQDQPGDSTLVGIGSFSRGSADVGAIYSGFGGLQQWPVVERHA